MDKKKASEKYQFTDSDKEAWKILQKNVEEDAELLKALNIGTKKVKYPSERKRK